MKNDNMACRRESLEIMPTEQLDELLQEELHRNPPDGDIIRLILSVLEDREKTHTAAPGTAVEEAWNKYLNRSRKASPVPVRRFSWVIQVASVVMIVCAFALVVPQTAEATGIFDRVTRWTDIFFEFLSFDDTGDSEDTYVFQTDNPGLQEIYDATVEMGVTEPVVPMWLPGNYELLQCSIEELNNKKSLSAVFGEGDYWGVLEISIYTESGPSKYYKDELQWITYEKNGSAYNIMRNGDMWIAVWTKDNIECFISIDCQEDELYRILESIYSMEGE